MEVNRHDPKPLHEQVAAEVRRAIVDGEISEGHRLPPAIDLAAVLGVNKNTVIRALHELRDEGLVDFSRGRGVRVVGTPSRSALVEKIGDLMRFAREQGYGPGDVVALIEEM